MQLDLEKPGPIDLYQLATHLVTPRPIAWVTSKNAEGIVNLAPFSYFGIVADDPILFVLSLSPRSHPEGPARKDTARNLVDNGQAVIHIVESDQFTAMLGSSASLPEDQSELLHLGLETVPSVKVAPPRLACSRLSAECVLENHWVVGNEPSDLFLLRAIQCHLSDEVLTDGLPDPRKTSVIGKLGGFDYTVTKVADSLKRA